MEEAGRRGESNGLFVTVKFLKGDGGGHRRASTDIRNDNGVVVNNDKEKIEVFTRYFENLYNPSVTTHRELLAELEAQVQEE